MLIELREITKTAWLFFLDLVFPVECLGCGREGDWLCPECFKSVKLKSGQYCLNCKKENDFGGFCPDCRPAYALTGVWIAALYDDPLVAAAVKSLKYHFVRGLAEVLARWQVLAVDNMLKRSRVDVNDLAAGVDRRQFERARAAPAPLLDFRTNLVVPVPLSKRRRRWRGFNQAEILAQAFAGYYGLELNLSGLIRLKHKKPQAKLPEAERLINVKNCFTWRGEDLSGRNVILLDDVVTTGATLNECAKVLKAAGAGQVWGLVAAKG